MSLRQVHAAIVARCTNKNHVDYPNYGGRGITVDSEWLGAGGCKRFITDVLMALGKCPEGQSLNRVDNNQGYFLKHPITGLAQLEWTTVSRQNRNRRGWGKSLYQGVYFEQTKNKWSARVRLSTGKLKRAGYHTTEQAAAHAVDRMVISNGLANPLNFPE